MSKKDKQGPFPIQLNQVPFVYHRQAKSNKKMPGWQKVLLFVALISVVVIVVGIFFIFQS